jgi:hypothetical protein
VFDTYLQFLVLERHIVLAKCSTLVNEAVLTSNHYPRTALSETLWGCNDLDFNREKEKKKIFHVTEK